MEITSKAYLFPFQDSDARQVEMIKLLVDCPTFESLMVVGDDSQSIYAFRGTTNEFILKFDEYMGTKVDDIYLLENHRSTPEIIEFANKINANNINRVIKDLIATRPHGKPVEVQGFISPEEERAYVIKGVKDHLAAGFQPEDIAIECYNRDELAEMASLLQKEGIPCVMLNPEYLIDNPRVRAAIALINALHDPTDTKDLLTFANASIGGGVIEMSDTEIAALSELTREKIGEYYTYASEEDRRKFLIDLLLSIDLNNDEIYQNFISKLQNKKLPKIVEYINDFYTYGAKSTAKRESKYPGVVLTTAHSSKGLEWKVVYNMISKYHDKKLSTKLEAIEERRRLLFVSSTRARDELYITGQYTAFGKKGDYTYNRFLVESYHALGKDFNVSNIETERMLRDTARKQKAAELREAARKKKEEFLKQQEAEKELEA